MDEANSLVVAWVALAAFYCVTIGVTFLRCARLRIDTTRPPTRCSIVLPVKGVSPFLAANVEALARIEPFAGEMLIAVADARDPALRLLAPIVARHADRMRLMIGESRDFANPKLRNLAKAYHAAREDTILFLDDTVELEPELLRTLLSAIGGRTAAATAAPLGGDANGLAAEIEAATCNGYQFRIEMLLDLLGMGAAFGNALAVDRRALEAAGGLSRLAEGPCEDNALSKALRAAGWRVGMVAMPALRRIGRRSWRDLWRRHLRWTNCSKCHDPLLYLFEPLAGGFCFNLVGALALSGAGIGWTGALACSMALWYGGEAILNALCRWPMTPASPLAWLLRDLIQPAVIVAAAFTRHVEWRGETIEMRMRWPWSVR